METGRWYSCLDPDLAAMRETARAACHAHRVMDPAARGALAPDLADLFASVGPDVFVEAPFHCAYGVNIHLGAQVYVNAGCVFLDSGMIRIGDRSMLGPHVQIYCADHHRDPARRADGLERARPVTVGRDVWIGGGAILLPGVEIGDGAIVGAGSVVTRTVASGATVIGSPARPVTA
ncbi:MAG: sugar O-acetyltransferase [Pseudomonadota bacterium]